MNKTYTATYYDLSGRFFNATIFLSSITLSIRFINEKNEVVDVYWLAENIVSLEPGIDGSTLTYNNSSGDGGKLLIRDPKLVEAIKKHFRHHRFVGGWRYHLLGNTKAKMLVFISALLALIIAGYLWFVPWLGERIASSMSKEWEISMGKKMQQSLLAEYKVDSGRSKQINHFFRELGFDNSYPITISVVDSKEINAFAVPGGHVVVYSSLLERIERPDELAALLSHEVSHIELRHSLRNIFRSLARKMFLALVIGNESGIAGFLVNNADNLKGLDYSRALETEADENGIFLMKSAGLNPKGMLSLIRILQAETKGNDSPGFLSTHPVFETRIKNIQKHVQKADTVVTDRKLLDTIFQRVKNPTNTDW